MANKQIKNGVTCGTQDLERIDIVKKFCDLAKQNNVDVTYKTYNIGHTLSPEQINDSLVFFEKIR